MFPPDSAPDPRVDRYDVMQFSTEHAQFMRYLRKPKPTRAEIRLDEKLLIDLEGPYPLSHVDSVMN